jgi:hypothetical protein
MFPVLEFPNRARNFLRRVVKKVSYFWLATVFLLSDFDSSWSGV